jgi:hypothetical protein
VEVREPGLVMDGFCAVVIGCRVKALVPRTRDFAVWQHTIYQSHLSSFLQYLCVAYTVLTESMS